MAIVQRGHLGGTRGTPWRFEHPPTSLTCYTAPTGQLTGLQLDSQSASGSYELRLGTIGTAHALDFAGQALSQLEVWTGHEPGYAMGLVTGLEIRLANGTVFTAGVKDGPPQTVHPRSGATLAGFAGNYGDRIDAIGLLCETDRVEVGVSLDTASSTPVTVDTTGTVELMEGNRIAWSSASSSQPFTFDRLTFYTDEAEQDVIANWTPAELHAEPGFLYEFVSPSTTALEIVENTGPTENVPYWYAIWIKDTATGTTYKLDPEVINFKKRGI